MIELFKVFMSSELDSVITTLKSGMITQGKKVEEFENRLKEYFLFICHPNALTIIDNGV